jgi:hypothetical protein
MTNSKNNGKHSRDKESHQYLSSTHKRAIASTTLAGIVSMSTVGMFTSTSAYAAWDEDNRAGEFSVGRVISDGENTTLNEIGAYQLLAGTSFAGAFAFCALESAHPSPTSYSGDYTQEVVNSWTGVKPSANGLFEPTRTLEGQEAAALAYINSRAGVAITVAAEDEDPDGPASTQLAILKMAQVVAADAVTTPEQEAFASEYSAQIEQAWQEAMDYSGPYTASVNVEEGAEGWQVVDIGAIADTTGKWYPHISNVELEVSGTASPTFNVNNATTFNFVTEGNAPSETPLFLDVEDPNGSIEVTATFTDLPTSDLIVLRSEDNPENVQPLPVSPLRDDSRSQNLFLLGQTEEVSATATRAAVTPTEEPIVTPPAEEPSAAPVVITPTIEATTTPSPINEQMPAEATDVSADSQDLAATGSNAKVLLGVGSALLLAGGASLAIARRFSSN